MSGDEDYPEEVDWFTQLDAEVWDDQIEADARNGKLLALSERALKDHELGR